MNWVNQLSANIFSYRDSLRSFSLISSLRFYLSCSCSAQIKSISEEHPRGYFLRYTIFIRDWNFGFFNLSEALSLTRREEGESEVASTSHSLHCRASATSCLLWVRGEENEMSLWEWVLCVRSALVYLFEIEMKTWNGEKKREKSTWDRFLEYLKQPLIPGLSIIIVSIRWNWAVFKNNFEFGRSMRVLIHSSAGVYMCEAAVPGRQKLSQKIKCKI